MSAPRLFRAATLTLVAALFATSAAYAADPPANTGRYNRWESRLQQKLNLSEDQLAELVTRDAMIGVTKVQGPPR